MDLTIFKPSVLWRTTVSNIIQLSDTTYRISVHPIDSNQPGAGTKEVDFWFKDNVGHTYAIIDVDTDTIDVFDSFGVGVCDQTGYEGVIYKPVWSGRALFIAPIDCYRFLDPSAKEYSNSLEFDALWSNDPNAKRIPFTSSSSPSIDNYQNDQLDGYNLAIDFGENPKVKLMQVDEFGNIVERSERPYIEIVDDLIDKISFPNLPDQISGYIEISK